MYKTITSLLWITIWMVLTPAEAGHELPYYPSFYPHEIRVEVVPPEVAATRLQQGTLHAYIGATPHFAEPPPAHVSPVASLGTYLVVTFDGAGPEAQADRPAAGGTGPKKDDDVIDAEYEVK